MQQHWDLLWSHGFLKLRELASKECSSNSSTLLQMYIIVFNDTSNSRQWMQLVNIYMIKQENEFRWRDMEKYNK